MEYLKIRNWKKWQSYRSDRSQPPWIKIHRCIMRNIEWVSLTDAERGQLVAIWLLAADHDGVIPASCEMIQKLCFMTEPPNINKFIDLEFIETNGCHIDATMTPHRRQPDANVTTQTRLEETRIYTASADADGNDFLLTKKKRKLKGKRLESFSRFWDAFNYKRGKAEAADSWYDIPSLTNSLVEEIIKAAEVEAKARPKLVADGKVPKMAQGWLSGRRWEDEITKPHKPEMEYL